MELRYQVATPCTPCRLQARRADVGPAEAEPEQAVCGDRHSMA